MTNAPTDALESESVSSEILDYSLCTWFPWINTSTQLLRVAITVNDCSPFRFPSLPYPPLPVVISQNPDQLTFQRFTGLILSEVIIITIVQS